jgi:hypothetical protein
MHHGFIAEGKQYPSVHNTLKTAEIISGSKTRCDLLIIVIKRDVQSPGIMVSADKAVSCLNFPPRSAGGRTTHFAYLTITDVQVNGKDNHAP